MPVPSLPPNSPPPNSTGTLRSTSRIDGRPRIGAAANIPPGERPSFPICAVARKPMGFGPLFLVSIALHVALAMGIAAAASQLAGPPAEAPAAERIEVLFAEITPGWVLPEPVVFPTPPEPPSIELPALAPPPPALLQPPAVEPSIATPPPQLPSATPSPSPLRARAAPARTRPAARAGGAKATTTTSREGAAPRGGRSGIVSWSLPQPPYPTSARIARITGNGTARIATDASGRVASCETRGLPPPLDSNTRRFARTAWKGPPNSARTVTVIYRLE